MLTPGSEAELAEIVKSADGQRFRVMGGGTRGLADRVSANAALTARGITGISLYEPGALTLVAAAGTPLDDIEAALDAEGQMLAFEPMDHRALLGTEGTPTIGGVVSANVSGPRRIQAGACRDAMLGVRFVTGDGAVVKNGGRVMKNVTGYDLVRLMTGANGTLGILTEVSLKVLPKAETATTVQVSGQHDPVAVMSAALTSPYDVTGAAHIPDRGTLIRVEGFEGSVAYRAGALATALGGHGSVDLLSDPQVWDDLRHGRTMAGQAAIWRVSVKPSDGPSVVDALATLSACTWSLDWGGGLVWIGVSIDQLKDAAADGPEDDLTRGAIAIHKSLQSHVSGIGGHTTLVHGPAGLENHVPIFQPPAPGVAALGAGLRAKFDPKGLFNLGLMG